MFFFFVLVTVMRDRIILEAELHICTYIFVSECFSRSTFNLNVFKARPSHLIYKIRQCTFYAYYACNIRLSIPEH